jgi:hypothetical protein
MDKRLKLLETFPALGDDGQRYVVHGFEHLVRLDGALDHLDRWEPTGQAEYKLASGEPIAVESSGAMKVARTGLRLTPLTPTNG